MCKTIELFPMLRTSKVVGVWRRYYSSNAFNKILSWTESRQTGQSVALQEAFAKATKPTEAQSLTQEDWKFF